MTRVAPSQLLHETWPERFKLTLRGTMRLSKDDSIEVRWDGEKHYSWYSIDELIEVDEGED